MLELKNISKDYKVGTGTFRALNDVSLKFRKGEFVAILGHSGCGKTTALNIIGGLDRYTEGDLIINGTSTKDFTERDWDAYRNNSVGFVFQSYNLINHLSVLDNVELGLTLSGVGKVERRERAIEVLTKVGLETHMYKQPIHEINLSSAQARINLPVQLILTDDFRNAKWEMSSLGSTFTMPVGENLVHHTIRLVRNVFTQPLILDVKTNPQGNNIEAEYTLRPEMVFIEQTTGVSGYSESQLSIGIEWNLARKTGAPVWIETIKGVGVERQGNPFFAAQVEGYQRKRLKSALQEVFEKSQEAMLSSPLLRRLEQSIQVDSKIHEFTGKTD